VPTGRSPNSPKEGRPLSQLLSFPFPLNCIRTDAKASRECARLTDALPALREIFAGDSNGPQPSNLLCCAFWTQVSHSAVCEDLPCVKRSPGQASKHSRHQVNGRFKLCVTTLQGGPRNCTVKFPPHFQGGESESFWGRDAKLNAPACWVGVLHRGVGASGGGSGRLARAVPAKALLAAPRGLDREGVSPRSRVPCIDPRPKKPTHTCLSAPLPPVVCGQLPRHREASTAMPPALHYALALGLLCTSSLAQSLRGVSRQVRRACFIPLCLSSHEALTGLLLKDPDNPGLPLPIPPSFTPDPFCVPSPGPGPSPRPDGRLWYAGPRPAHRLRALPRDGRAPLRRTSSSK
jgi:hypothetical protein